MRDSVLRAEIRGPDSRFSEHTCLWLLVPAPGCEPKLTVTADVKWQGHIHTQRKAILVGSTLAELEYRVQSPRLLASRISSSSRKPVYAGPPLQPAGLSTSVTPILHIPTVPTISRASANMYRERTVC